MNEYNVFPLEDRGEIASVYDKETVAHLVDQLIKLQREYSGQPAITGKTQTEKAMKTINEALELALLHTKVISHD